MKLITKEIEAKLSKNSGKPNEKPYLKLFSPIGSATWLISEYDKSTGLLFGLCDLGMGFPELGYVSLLEIQETTFPLGMKIERDMYFSPSMTLSEYADQARKDGCIIA